MSKRAKDTPRRLGGGLRLTLRPAIQRGIVESILREKLDEIRAEPRYENKGYWNDDAQVYVERGGFANDRSDRAVAGFTKADVQEVVSALADHGLAAEWNDVDAVLMQAIMGGGIDEMTLSVETGEGGEVVVPLRDADKNRMASSADVVVNQWRVVERAPGVTVVRDLEDRSYPEIVVATFGETVCTCRLAANCSHREAVAQAALLAQRKNFGQFTLHNEHVTDVARGLLQICSRFGAASENAVCAKSARSAGRPSRTVISIILHLLIAEALGDDYADGSNDLEQLVSAHVLDRCASGSLARYRKRSDVRDLLAHVHTAAARSIRDIGVESQDVVAAASVEQMVKQIVGWVSVAALRERQQQMHLHIAPSTDDLSDEAIDF